MSNRDKEVAARQRLDPVAILREILARELPSFAFDHNIERLGLESGAKRSEGTAWGVKGREADDAMAIIRVADDGRAVDDVVFAGWGEDLRHPGDRAQEVTQGHGVGDLEPGVVHHEAAVDVVFRHARLVTVVGGEDLHAPGDFAGPLALGLHAVLGKRHDHLHGPVPERAPAAAGRFGKGPRPAVDLARRIGADARVVDEKREDVAHIVLPVWEVLLVVHHVAGRELGDVFGLDRVGPVPIVATPGVVHGPCRQKHVAQVHAPSVAGLDDRIVLARVAQADQLVEKVEDEHHPAGLLVVFPRGGLGIGVAAPGRGWHGRLVRPCGSRTGLTARRAGSATGSLVAVLGEQVAPVLAGLEPPLVAGHLVRLQEPQAGLGDNIELDHPLRVALAVGLALGGDADEELRPGVVGRGEAVVQQGVGLEGHQADRRRVARVAVIVHQPQQHVRGPLAQVAVVPVVDGHGRDGAVRGDLPVPVEYVVRDGGSRGLRVGPRVSLERLGRDAHAEVQLPVLRGVPWCDNPIFVVDRGVGVVALLELGRAGGGGKHGRQHGHGDGAKCGNAQDSWTAIGWCAALHGSSSPRVSLGDATPLQGPCAVSIRHPPAACQRGSPGTKPAWKNSPPPSTMNHRNRRVSRCQPDHPHVSSGQAQPCAFFSPRVSRQWPPALASGRAKTA